MADIIQTVYQAIALWPQNIKTESIDQAAAFINNRIYIGHNSLEIDGPGTVRADSVSCEIS